jgi:hypothetical protein
MVSQDRLSKDFLLASLSFLIVFASRRGLTFPHTLRARDRRDAQMRKVGSILVLFLLTFPHVAAQVQKCKRYSFTYPEVKDIFFVGYKNSAETWEDCNSLQSAAHDDLRKRLQIAQARETEAQKHLFDPGSSVEQMRADREAFNNATQTEREASSNLYYGLGYCTCTDKEPAEIRPANSPPPRIEPSAPPIRTDSAVKPTRSVRSAETPVPDAEPKVPKPEREVAQPDRTAESESDSEETVPPANDETAKARAAADEAKAANNRKAKEAYEAIVNPSGRPTASRGNRSTGLDTNFPDPFSTPKSSKVEGPSREQFSASKDVVESGIATAQKSLDGDIATVLKEKGISATQRKQYLESAEDLKGALGGLDKLVRGAGYAVLVADVTRADSPKGKQKAEGELVKQFISDLAKEPVAKGASELAAKMFGKEAVAALAGPAAFVAVVGSDVLSSTETGRDETEIIRDKSESLKDKQKALYRMYQWYDKRGDSWGRGQLEQLAESTRIVLDECVKDPACRQRQAK